MAGASGAALGLTLLAGNGLCWALAGRAYFEQVFLFHAAKVSRSGETVNRALTMLFDNWFLLAGGVLGGLLAIARPGRDQATVTAALSSGAVVLHFAAVMVLPRAFSYYFLPCFAPAAVALVLGLDAGATALRQGSTGRLARPMLLVAALALFGGDRLRRWTARWRSTPESAPTTFFWVDGPRIGPVNALLRRAFWQDTRQPGRSHGPITEYLWQASRYLDTHAAMVAALRSESERAPGAALFGDALAAPALALAAQVPIAGDLIDTNPQRFDAGFLSFAEVRRLLDGSPRTLVLVRAWGFGSATGAEARQYLQAHYDQMAAFESRWGLRHVLLRRRQERPGGP